MARAPEFRWSPAPRRRSGTALLVSAALHLVAVLAWRAGVRLPEAAPSAPTVFVIAPSAATHDSYDLPVPAAVPGAVPAPVVGDAPVRPPLDASARDGGETRVPAPMAAATPNARAAGAPQAAVTPADTGSARVGARGRLGPAYADGHLWVEPYPVTPSDIARGIQRSHVQLVDSAVTAIVQAYLDTLAVQPGADAAELPSWVADVGGKKFGLDSRFIYVAGLKIPSVLLALLPFPQGNVDQALANRRLADLRADLYQAAQRAENAEEFKRAIREIRERKVQEEEFERNRRTRPEPLPDE